MLPSQNEGNLTLKIPQLTLPHGCLVWAVRPKKLLSECIDSCSQKSCVVRVNQVSLRLSIHTSNQSKPLLNQFPFQVSQKMFRNVDRREGKTTSIPLIQLQLIRRYSNTLIFVLIGIFIYILLLCTLSALLHLSCFIVYFLFI